MYPNSDLQVRWKSELPNVFPLMNGVKQGGCLSPILFTYFNRLIKRSGIGFHLGRTLCEVFSYADGLAIVTPTPFDRRQMNTICQQYTSEMDLLYNSKNSKLLCH